MRVVFFTHYAALYGANRSLLALIDGLRPHGVEPFVISRKAGHVVDALRARRVPTEVVPFALWTSRRRSARATLRHLWRNVCLLRSLRRQLDCWQIDLVYTNSSVTPIGAMAARVARRPHVWHLREFGEVDYALQHDLGLGLTRKIIGRAEAQIAVSEALRRYLVPQAARARVIYNGVAWAEDCDRYYARAHSRASSAQPFTFVLVGGISAGKGQDVAIRALAAVASHYPSVRLLLVGGGRGTAYLEHCRVLARDLGVGDRVEFWGYLRDPYRAYLAADTCLVCSRSEAMGRSAVEAMLACLPVIGHDTGGTSELIEHEHTGLLYRNGPEELAACMERLIANPAWARTLGENGWQTARERYTIEAYATQVHEVLRSLVPGRRVEQRAEARAT